MRNILFIFILTISLCLTVCKTDNNEDSVIDNPYVPPPKEIEKYPLPSTQSIIETVQNLGATSATIATYTVNGNNVTNTGTTTPSNASIVIRVNYSYNGLGTIVPSQAGVTLAIRDLFTGFTNVTASVNSTVMFPLPSHSSVIAIATEQNAENVRVLEYTANNAVIGEFYYGSISSSTPIKISIAYDIGANVNLVEQAVRGLFQHFTNVGITTMLKPPTREEIISELYNEGAESVNIKSYTITGSNAIEGFRAKNVNIFLDADYTTSATTSNGQTAVRRLFYGFTNANIFVGNNIPVKLPTAAQISNAIYLGNSEMYNSNINTYTINGIDASTLSFANSSDSIILRIRSLIWISTGINLNSWDPIGYYQIVSNSSVMANNAKVAVKQLFIDTGFNHANNITITFE
jgi:hypothetical protein